MDLPITSDTATKQNGEMPIVSELAHVPRQLSVQTTFITSQIFTNICSSSNILLPGPHYENRGLFLVEVLPVL